MLSNKKFSLFIYFQKKLNKFISILKAGKHKSQKSIVKEST